MDDPEVDVKLLVLSLALSAGLLAWSRRHWLPVADGRPWWRTGVLTGVEDLRVGATAAALTAALCAAGAAALADAWHDRLGPLQPVHAVVVSRTLDTTVVVVAGRGPRPARQLRVEDPSRASVGSIVSVYAGRHAAVTDDEPPAWNVCSGSCVLLLLTAVGAAAGS